MRGLIVALCIVGASGTGEAHPGGTDRFGCHIDHSTGVRHCHNGDSEGGGVPPVLAAEAGAEFGSSWRAADGEEISYFGAIDVQHDGSMLFLANVGGHYPRRRGTVCFADLGVGIAWLGRADVFLAAQFVIGAKVPLVYLNDGDRAPYVKVGVFIDLIADGNPAETLGIAASLGFTL